MKNVFELLFTLLNMWMMTVFSQLEGRTGLRFCCKDKIMATFPSSDYVFFNRGLATVRLALISLETHRLMLVAW